MNIAMKLWNALKVGKAVADPAKWKAHQVSVNQVTVALGAALLLLKGTKYDPHMDDATVGYLAAGLFGLVNWLFTVVTTDKIGVFGQPAVPAPAAPAANRSKPADPGAGPVPALGSDATELNAPDPVRVGPAADTGPTGTYMP